MTRPPNATFSCHLQGDVVVVRIVGEIDVADTGHISDSLAAAVLLADRLVVLDLSGLAFLDVAATRALRVARSHAFKSGVSLVLAAPTSSVAYLLSRTDPDGYLPIYGSVVQASSLGMSGRSALRRLHAVPALSGPDVRPSA